MTNLPYPYLDRTEFPSVDPKLLDALQGNLDALALDTDSLTARSWPGTVTSLPASPTNGQEVFYVADDTNGVVWHLKYRSASASAYKWEFVGGAPMSDANAANENITSTSYVDGGTVGPTVTVPLAGDYDVTGAGVFLGPAGGAVFGSLKIGASATSDSDRLAQVNEAVAVSGGRSIRRTVTVASTALKMQYRVTTGTGNIDFRSLSVTPVRVG